MIFQKTGWRQEVTQERRLLIYNDRCEGQKTIIPFAKRGQIVEKLPNFETAGGHVYKFIKRRIALTSIWLGEVSRVRLVAAKIRDCKIVEFF